MDALEVLAELRRIADIGKDELPFPVVVRGVDHPVRLAQEPLYDIELGLLVLGDHDFILWRDVRDWELGPVLVFLVIIPCLL